MNEQRGNDRATLKTRVTVFVRQMALRCALRNLLPDGAVVVVDGAAAAPFVRTEIEVGTVVSVEIRLDGERKLDRVGEVTKIFTEVRTAARYMAIRFLQGGTHLDGSASLPAT